MKWRRYVRAKKEPVRMADGSDGQRGLAVGLGYSAPAYATHPRPVGPW